MLLVSDDFREDFSERIQPQGDNLRGELKAYVSRFDILLRGLDLECLVNVSRILKSKFSQPNSFIFVCGNGGSSALSQHFAVDLGVGTRRVLKEGGCRIFDLTSNSAIMTALANDTGYENVFANQIDLYGKRSDLLIAISSSGNSKNVINAVRKAKEKGVTSIGLTGFEGGQIRALVDYSVHIETEIGNYGMVEDMHSFILHALTYLIRLPEPDFQ